jgi:hypothetical protein
VVKNVMRNPLCIMGIFFQCITLTEEFVAMSHDCRSRLSGRLGQLVCAQADSPRRAEEKILLNPSLEKRGKGRFYGE